MLKTSATIFTAVLAKGDALLNRVSPGETTGFTGDPPVGASSKPGVDRRGEVSARGQAAEYTCVGRPDCRSGLVGGVILFTRFEQSGG